MSLLGAEDVGIYTSSPILRGDTIGFQYMEITHYEIMFGATKDVSDGLWDAGLYLLQQTCAFVLKTTTSLVIVSLDIYIYWE